MKIEDLDERALFALCLYGEARGEAIEGKVAVASVIINRIKKGGRFGRSLREVILKPMQFSCFNEDDPNKKQLESLAKTFYDALQINKSLRECFWVSCGFLDGWLQSNVKDADHYHALDSDPKWNDNMKLVAVIGKHKFFKDHGH